MRVIIPAGIHIIGALIKSPINKCNLEGMFSSLSLHHGSFLNIHFNHISSSAEKLDVVFLFVACIYCIQLHSEAAGVNNCTWSTDVCCFYGSHTKHLSNKGAYPAVHKERK